MTNLQVFKALAAGRISWAEACERIGEDALMRIIERKARECPLSYDKERDTQLGGIHG